jgi:hypothetical protein
MGLTGLEVLLVRTTPSKEYQCLVLTLLVKLHRRWTGCLRFMLRVGKVCNINNQEFHYLMKYLGLFLLA